MNRRPEIRAFLAVFFLLATVRLSGATDFDDGSGRLDTLAYDTELTRQERLMETRRSADAMLTPFVSDGCSGGLSAGWSRLSAALPRFAKTHGDLPPWENCCVDHDRTYHAAGRPAGTASDGFEDRRKADEELRQCVLRVGDDRRASLKDEYGLSNSMAKALYAGVADTMYRAVRLGGAPCSGLPWRWGFGWPACP